MIDKNTYLSIMNEEIKNLAYIEVNSINMMIDYIEYDLHDYHNKVDEFERDIEILLHNIDKKLPEDVLFSHKYSEKYDICGIAGEKVPDYHCYIKIYEKEL